MSTAPAGLAEPASPPFPGGFLNDGGVTLAPPAVAQPLDPDAAKLEFVDDRAGFWRLLARGSALQIVTFGFYRFWFVTELRRWLWQAIRLRGASLEYLGTGRELLTGFLLALTITVPLNVAAFASSLGLEFIHPFLSTASIALFVVFGEYARYRARRYRLTRTVFRGIRFWMDGSALAYTWRATLWTMATILTLGLALPWQMAALERYKMRHSHYGSLAGDFAGTGGRLFRSAGWIWLVCMAAFLPVAWFVPAMPLPESNHWLYDHLARVLVGAGAAALVLAALYPLFVARSTRWFVDGLSFGPVTFRSSLSGLEVFATYALNLIVIAVYLVLATAIAVALGGLIAMAFGIDWQAGLRRLGNAEMAWPAWGMAVYLALGYLAIFVGQGMLKLFFLGRNLWRLTMDSIELRGIAALDAVEARGDLASSLGEGLADALDAGGL